MQQKLTLIMTYWFSANQEKRVFTRHTAAVVIQRAWRKHIVSFICNYILFTKFPWPGDSEGTFRSLSQAATCPYVSTTQRWTLHTVP